MQADPALSAFSRFQGTPEAMDMVAQYCPWLTAVTLSRVDTVFRRVIQLLIRTRTLHLLTKFMDRMEVPAFFALLDSTGAVIAGSIVRCIMSIDTFCYYRQVYPIQLNIILPNTFDNVALNGPSLSYLRWCAFFKHRGFRDVNGNSIGSSPMHLAASAKEWTLFNRTPFDDMRVSIIQSRTCSALSPILQSCHTSNFFAMSSTRIYCMYPKLFAAKVNLNTKITMPPLGCAFDSFNYGLVSFSCTDIWHFMGGGCGEACPSVYRRTYGLPGTGVFRWGGYLTNKDGGGVVSKDDGFGDRAEIWKVQGECSNRRCPCIFLYVSLFDSVYRA